MNRINTLKPGFDKFWLFVVASLMWSGAGIYLDLLAFGWLRPADIGLALLLIASGLLLAVVIYAIMFKRFADLNILRIRNLTGDKVCIFAFQRWTSYPLVVVMISLGIFLRVYSPIPKPFLAVLYSALEPVSSWLVCVITDLCSVSTDRPTLLPRNLSLTNS